MNILFLENLVNPEKGGVQRVTHILATELTLRGHACYVAHSEHDNYKDEKAFKKILLFNGDNSTLKDFIIENNICIAINQLARCKNLVRSLYTLQKELKFHIISCLHTSPTSSIDSCRYNNIRFVKDYFRAKIKHLILSFKRIDIDEMQFAYQYSDKFIVLSPSYIPQIEDTFPVNHNNILSISNPITYDVDTHELFPKKKEILVVSRMNENQKRISLILKLWHNIYKIIPDWELYLVGEGSYLSCYKKFAHKLNLERIHFEGRRDPRPYYKRASIFLMTSSFEGFGMTLIEAQQWGVVPIVFDTCTAFKDIIQNQEDGLLIPEGAFSSFISAIIELTQNEIKRDKMAHNAIESSKKFNKESIVSQWECLFQSLINK